MAGASSAQRAELSDYSQRLHARGWVANHDGNVTLRLGKGRWLATPTAVSKADVVPEILIEVDAGGKVVAGKHRPFSELALHLAIYETRPEVAAVVHAHPPHACAFAVRAQEIPVAMMAEPVVSLGPKIPTIAYQRPKSPEWAPTLAAAFRDANAVVMAQHGVFACGPDLETAYLRLELVEHLARIAWLARGLGGEGSIPAADAADLAAGWRKSPLAPSTVATPASPAPSAAAPPPVVARGVNEIVMRIENRLGAGRITPELRALIAAEVAATLGDD